MLLIIIIYIYKGNVLLSSSVSFMGAPRRLQPPFFTKNLPCIPRSIPTL